MHVGIEAAHNTREGWDNQKSRETAGYLAWYTYSRTTLVSEVRPSFWGWVDTNNIVGCAESSRGFFRRTSKSIFGSLPGMGRGSWLVARFYSSISTYYYCTVPNRYEYNTCTVFMSQKKEYANWMCQVGWTVHDEVPYSTGTIPGSNAGNCTWYCTTGSDVVKRLLVETASFIFLSLKNVLLLIMKLIYHILYSWYGCLDNFTSSNRDSKKLLNICFVWKCFIHCIAMLIWNFGRKTWTCFLFLVPNHNAYNI